MSSSNYSSKIYIWRILAFCLVALVSTASVLATVTVARAAILAAPSISVTKSDAIIDDGVLLAEAADGKADPGETIEYSVFINNSGPDPATGVAYNDTIDANTTLLAGSINVSPLAGDDTYATIGNTLLEVGVTASGSPAVRVTSAAIDSLFDNDTEFLGDTFTLKSVEADTVAPFTTATESGGSVTVEANGTFSYTPVVGFSGADHFDYVITDDGPDNIPNNADDLTGAGRVTINVNTQTVWYVDNNAAAGGLGRSSDPFDTLAEAQTASAANQTIYIAHAGGDLTGQNSGILLKDGQRLIGEGVELVVPVILVHQGVNGPNPTSLKAAGSHPRIGNTAGDGISVSNDVPSEIRGLSISGFSNAIALVIADASTGTMNIKDNIIFGATNDEGILISYGGSTTVNLDVQNNTWNTSSPTHDGNALDVNATATGNLNLNFSNNTNILSTGGNGIVLVDAGGAGLLTVTGFANNTIHGDTPGAGVTANTVIFDATPGGAFDLVSGGTTTVGASGNGVGGSGMMLVNVSGNLSFTDLDIVTSNGTGLSATSSTPYTGSAGFRLAVGAGVATVDANGGPALTLSIVDMSLPFSAVTSVNSTSTGVSLGSVTGTFSAGSGSSITNASTTDFVVSNSNATITYNGSITDTAGPGVSLSTNTGSTIAFTGPLTISSGASAAFSAVGGGTVTSTNTASTLTSTSGTALNVANTTIGASGLTFRSISANGATNGIVLNTTGSSGGLTITGNSSGLCGGSVNSSTLPAVVTAPNTADCTGGTIQNTTGAAILLTNTRNVSITRLRLINSGNDGVQGTNVTGFTLSSSFLDGNGNALNENGLDFGDSSSVTPDGLHGTGSITNSTVQNSYYNGVSIRNNGGTALTSFDVTGSQFRASAANGDANDSVFMEAGGTANMVISVSDSHFSSIEGDHFQTAALNSGTLNVNFTNNTLTGGHSTPLGQGITINAATGVPGWSGRIDYDVNGNHITGAVSNGVSVVLGTSSAAAVFDGFVRNNIIGTSGSSLSCSTQANGVYIDARGNGTHNSAVTNNVIRQCFDRGILAEAGDGDSTLNLTVTGNTIDEQVAASAREAFQTNFGITSTNVFSNIDTNNVCLQFGGAGALANILSNGADPSPDDFRLRKRFEATVRLPGYGGGTGQDAGSLAQVVAFIQGQNTGSAGEPGSASASGTGGGYTGGAGCTQPVAGMLPDGNNILAQSQPESNAETQSVVANTGVAPVSIEKSASNGALGSVMKHDLPARSSVANVSTNPGNGKPLFALVQPAPAQSGDVLPTVTIGTLPSGKSVTIEFRATVDALDPGEIRTRILNQGTVSGSNFTSLTTTDPSPNADPFCIASPSIGTQTCTPVDRPNTTVVSLTRQSANPNKNASVTWQIVFTDAVDGLTASNFSLVSGGSVTGAVLSLPTETSGPPSTTWNITATTGTGDGTLELRMANDTGLSHDVTNQPYTEPASGAEYTIDKTAPTVTNVTSSTANGYYSVSDVISIQVVFDESVTVAGTPQLTLETGATDAVVDYDSGSANTLTFTYTVAAGENSSDLNYASINALTGTIQDAAGNSATLTLPALAAAQSLGSNKNIVIDTSAPTVTINQKSSAPAQADPTNASPINFTVVFSESVNPSFATGDVSLGAGTAPGVLVGTVTEIAPNDGTTYTVAVSGMTGDGTVIASILAGSAQDLAGNGTAASTSGDNTVTYDITPPAAPLVLTPANGSVINDTTPTITGTSAANVTIDVLIDGLSVGTTTSDGSGNWSFTPASALSEGPHNVKATAADSVGNISPDSNTNTFTVDTSAPTVTINQAVAQTDPTGASPINFTVIFSEVVTGFATGDVTLSASTAPGTLVGTVTGSGTTYNVAVSGMTGDGTVIAAIAAGVAGDGANTNLASTSTDNSVVYDTVVPSVTINQAVGQADPTNSGTINFTVIFSEAVTDFNDAADVSLSGTAGATTSLITGGPTTYNVAVSGMTSDGTVIADIPANAAQDAGGNDNTPSTSTDNTITYDATAPTVTINQAVGQADPTNVGTINFTVVFSGAVIDFDDAADVTLGGTAGATTVNITGGPATYNVAVSGMVGDGTVVASIPVGAAQDAATNGNSASTSTDNTVTYDTTPPTVTINQAISQVDPASSSPINFTVVFSQAVTDFDDAADVTLSGTAGATIVTITGGPTTYNVAVSGMTSDGTVIAAIAANRAQDLAGNGNAASSSTDNSVIYDSQVPSVTINQAVGQADPTNSGPINFTVAFSEAVTDFDDAADVNLSGTAGATTSLITGGPATYNVAVSGMAGAGTVIVDIPAGAAIDVASNLNTVSTSSDNTVTYDATAPTVTINQSGSQADPTNVSPVNFTVIFSEAVTDFDDAADVILAGTAGATTAAITGGPTTYNVAVSGMISSGTVIATIPAGVVLELAGNTNIASTSTDNEVNYIYDVDPPMVVSSVRTDPNPTAAVSVSYTVTFSESVSGVDAADFILNPTGTISGAAVTGVSGTGTTYNVTVNTGTGTGTLRLDIPATATIVDLGANPLSGLPYLGGEAYTVRVPDFGKIAPTDGAASQSLSPTLSWQASYGATSYEYCYSSAPGPCTKWNSVGTDTSVALSGLAANYTYYWQVRAVHGDGTTEADGGTWWSFTTTAALSCTFNPYTPPSTPSFVDVPAAHWAWDWIERYYSAGLTTGCAWVPGGYCPGDLVTREQMAVFIMRAKNCGNYTPAPVTGPVFSDVPANHWAAGFIRDFANAGIATSCAWVPGGYCPGDLVTREQMAVFVIRATHGGTYSPPAVTGPVFTDVPASHWAATFIKQFYDEGITTGCAWVPGGYCPGDFVTREQMAVFIGRAFNLP